MKSRFTFQRLLRSLHNLNLRPHSKCKVPAARRESSAIGRDLQAGHFVLVSVKQTNPLRLQRIPNIHRVVIVAGKQQAATHLQVE